MNIDEDWAFADGLGAGEWEALQRALGPTYLSRVKRVPRLAVEFIAHRLPEMMPIYREREETVHAIISQAFSSAVITPGVTTTEDVQWWLREKVQALGMTTWFHPSVDVQRAGEIPSGGPRGHSAWRSPLDGFRHRGHEPPHGHPTPGVRVSAR